MLDAGLAADGTVLRVGDRDTGDLYEPGPAGETIRLRPLETGLLEMTTWKDGTLVRLEHLRRKAGTGATPNDCAFLHDLARCVMLRVEL